MYIHHNIKMYIIQIQLHTDDSRTRGIQNYKRYLAFDVLFGKSEKKKKLYYFTLYLLQ